MRRAVGDKELSDLLLHGLPALVKLNLSDRIGAGSMVHPMSFVEYEASRGGVDKMIASAAGPFIGGLIPQIADGLNRISQGDVAQGMAQLLPRELRDATRAVLASQEGVRLRNGDTAIPPEALSLYDEFMMGIGMPTLPVTSRMEQQRKVKVYEQSFQKRTTALKRSYKDAYDRNNRAAIEDWQRLQETKKRLGFTPKALSELLKSPRERESSQKRLVGGVAANRSSVGFVETLQ